MGTLCAMFSEESAANTLSRQISVPADTAYVIDITSRAQKARLVLSTGKKTLASRVSQAPILQREVFLVGPLSSDSVITVSLTEESDAPQIQMALAVSAMPSPKGSAHQDNMAEQAQLLNTLYQQTRNKQFRSALDNTYRYYQDYGKKLIFQCHLLSQYLPQADEQDGFRYELLADISRSLSELDRLLTDFNRDTGKPDLNQPLYKRSCALPLRTAVASAPSTRHTFGDALLSDAKVLLDVALRGSQQTQNTLLEARVLYRLWYYYNRIGDTRKAALIIRQALDALQQSAYRQNELVEMTGSAATTLMELGRYVEAAQVMALGDLQSADVQHIHRETVLFSKAFLYRKLGEYEASQQFFYDILSNYTLTDAPAQEGPCDHRYQPSITVGQVMTQLGILRNQQAAYEQAVTYLHCAIAHFPQTGVYYRLIAELELAKAQWLRTPSVDALLSLPDKHRLARAQIPQQLTAALLKLDVYGSHKRVSKRQAAEQQLASLFGHPNFFAPCDDGDATCLKAQQSRAFPLKQIEAFRLLIKVTQEEASPDRLAYYFSRASDVLKHIRSEAILPQAWTEAQYSLVEEYVNVLLSKQWMQGTPLKAHLFTLLEDFYSLQLEQEKRLYAASSGSPQARDKQEQAFRTWMQKEQQVLAAPAQTIADAKGEANRARAAFFRHVPQTYSKPYETRVLSLKEVQQRLTEEERLVRFFVGQQHQFALLVGPQEIQLFDLSEVDMQLWGNLANNDIDWQTLISPPQGNALLPYQQLVRQGVKKLILIPDGHLHRLPFSALGIQASGDLYQSLGEQFELVRTFSASGYFAAPPPQLHTRDADIALFAATRVKPAGADMSGLAGHAPARLQRWLNSLAPIPGVLSEIEHIASLFNGSRLHKATDEQATRAFLLSENARSADLLHIATHGLFNPDVPDIVGLMAFEDAPQKGVGLLTLNELFSQPFDSDLVVISGCNTMMGRNYKGSGMRSLTRGFMAQGARSVMGTLWSVPDGATSRFMRQFYNNLVAHDLNVAKALHKTKRFFARHRRFRHPKYWAAFVLTAKNQQYETLPMASALLASHSPTLTLEVSGF